MSYSKISAILLLIIFYSAYMLKIILQRKKGIQTNQLGKGEKSRMTIRIEKILSIATIIIVPIEVFSILGYPINANKPILTGVGLILVGVGTSVFCLAMWQMRDNWRAGISTCDQTELVTNGIYRWSRNPAFLGFDFMYIGISIGFYNPLLVITTLWVVSMMHLQIIEEEKFLSETFKENYVDYCKQTGRYLTII